MPQVTDSGRKKDQAWLEVADLKDTNTGMPSNSKVLCRYCETVISKKIERVKAHLSKCNKRKAPPSEQETIISETDDLTSPRPLSSSCSYQLCRTESRVSTSSSTSGSHSFISYKRIRDNSMDPFITKTSNEKSRLLNKQVAKFFFSQNVPFHAVESEHFRQMCQDLRPGYTPPNRKMLGGELLDEIYDEVKEKTAESMLQVKTVCITQDGWSSVQNDPVIAHAFCDGQKTYLLNLIEYGTAQKTAEYCAQILCKAIQQMKNEYQKDVFAICTDNEAKMKKLRRLLNVTYPDMITYGCNAHYLALLEADTSSMSVMKKVLEVHKFFRNVHLAHGLLKEKGGKQPQLPNNTRWNSHIACLETFNANHSIYVEVRTEYLKKDKSMPDNVAKNIDNIGLLRKTSRLLDQVNKFGVALDTLQREKCTIQDACHVWYGLLKDDELEPFRHAISVRFKEAVSEPHLLAYMTDPQYHDKWEENVTQDLQNEVEEWLSNKNPEYLIEFFNFKLQKSETYPKHMFTENIRKLEASDWWSLINRKCSSGTTAEFARFMKSLHSCPASSAGIERCFSTVGFVWSKARNRLGMEKAKKLATVYRALRSKDCNSERRHCEDTGTGNKAAEESEADTISIKLSSSEIE